MNNKSLVVNITDLIIKNVISNIKIPSIEKEIWLGNLCLHMKVKEKYDN